MFLCTSANWMVLLTLRTKRNEKRPKETVPHWLDKNVFYSNNKKRPKLSQHSDKNIFIHPGNGNHPEEVSSWTKIFFTRTMESMNRPPIVTSWRKDENMAEQADVVLQLDAASASSLGGSGHTSHRHRGTCFTAAESPRDHRGTPDKEALLPNHAAGSETGWVRCDMRSTVYVAQLYSLTEFRSGHTARHTSGRQPYGRKALFWICHSQLSMVIVPCASIQIHRRFGGISPASSSSKSNSNKKITVNIRQAYWLLLLYYYS
jgi:hypothetical protein